VSHEVNLITSRTQSVASDPHLATAETTSAGTGCDALQDRRASEVRVKLSFSVSWLVRVVLGGIFVASGLAKLQQPYDFLSSVYSYGIVGPDLGYVAAFVLPWLEFVIGVCLLAGVIQEGALLVSAILLAIFTVAKFSAVHRDLQIGCGCQITEVGGIVGIQDVLSTGLLFVVAAVGFWNVLWRSRHV
jgi:uncharacterized membrane protein YphA (DoxX/SURF4 family)